MNKVCPSFCPSFCFLGIGSLVFFTGTQHGMRAPCGAVHDRAGFFENNVFGSKKGKIGQAQGSLNV